MGGYSVYRNEGENGDIKRVLLDIAKGEKIHVGEFQALLLTNDKEQEKEL